MLKLGSIAILSYLNGNPNSSTRVISSRLGIHRHTIRVHAKYLKAWGFITYKRSGLGGEYHFDLTPDGQNYLKREMQNGLSNPANVA